MFLLIPGFITDVVGGLLLIPFVRSQLAKPAVTRILTGNPYPTAYRDGSGQIIIEGSYREEEEDVDDSRPLIEDEDKDPNSG